MGVVQSYNTRDTELTKLSDKIAKKYYLNIRFQREKLCYIMKLLNN